MSVFFNRFFKEPLKMRVVKHWLLLVLFMLQPFGGVFAQQPDTPKHLFILSGQSNMRAPLPETFKHCVEQVYGKDRVIVVQMAWPSQPIKNWYKAWVPPKGMVDEKPESNGMMYGRLLPAVQKAIAAKQIATTTYIWMQGEADAGSGWGSVYEKSFYGVLDQFKKDLEIDRINFVVGRINDKWLDRPDGELMRTIQQKLGEENENGDWINTDDLNRGVNPWGGYSFEDGHFPPPGYRVMGQRFAKKACKLIDPEIKLDRKVFEEVFFDSAEDVKGHAAIGKKVSGDALDANDTGGNDGLGVLLDGQFAALDHQAEGWIGFAPSDEAIELVVDLGEVIEIDTIAVNTLLTSAGSATFPDKVIFITSEDGETYQINNSRYNSISFANRKNLVAMRSKEIKPQALLMLTEQRQKKAKVPARYIKIEVQTGKQWVFIDEILVNSTAR